MTTLIPKFEQPLNNAVNRAINLKLQETLSILDFGGVADGVTDNTTAYNNAVSAIKTSGEKYNLYFPVGTYKFNSGITLDVTIMTIEGSNATFDFSGITSTTTAITVTGSTGTQYNDVETAISNIVVKGPGLTGTTIGIYFNATTEPGPSHVALQNVVVTNFNYGVSYGANAYILTFNHCNFYSNNRGFQTYVGSSNNSGERITFINSSIFNNTNYGVRLEDTNASIHLIGTSLDYNTQALYNGAGALHLTSCFLEFTNPINGNDPYFLYSNANGGNTVMTTFSDCTFKIGAVTTASATPVFDVLLGSTVSHSNCYFYLNSNRTVIFSVDSTSVYNETNAYVAYTGGTFRSFASGAGYTISSSGSNNVGIVTTGDIEAFNPNYNIHGITPISDIFTSPYATGNTATSNIILSNGVYTLYTHTQTNLNSAQVGMYLIQVMGTSYTINTIVNDSFVTVTVNGTFNVVVTNSSGSSKTLDCIIKKQAKQNL